MASFFNRIRPGVVVFTASLFFLFEFINMNSFDVLNDALRQAFSVDALAISNMSAMYFYANVLFLIPAGLLLDRFSTRKILLLAMLIVLVSNVVFATTDHFAVAKACRFVTGMGSTLCLLSTTLLTSRWFNSRHYGLVMGLVIVMPMLGGVLAQQVASLVAALGSWRDAVLVIVALGVIFFILIAIFVKDYPQGDALIHSQEMKRLHQEGFWQSFKLALKNRQTWLAGLFTCLVNLPVMVLGALWGHDYLMVVHRLGSVDASNIVAMIFIGLMIGSPLFGFISDKIRRRKLPMCFGAVMILFTTLIILYDSQVSLMSLHMLFLCLGIFSGSQIITYPLVIESNPLHITASSESLSATLIMSGGAIFQPLFGWLLLNYSTNSEYDINAFQHAVLILPLAFVVSIVITFFLKETYCRPYGEMR